MLFTVYLSFFLWRHSTKYWTWWWWKVKLECTYLTKSRQIGTLFFGLEKRLQLGSHQLGNCDFALPSFNLKYLFCFVLFCFKIISFYEIIWSNPDSSGRIFEAKQRGEWKRKKPSFARTKRGRFAANFPKGGGGNYTFHLFVCFPRFLPAFCHYKTLMNTQRSYS